MTAQQPKISTSIATKREQPEILFSTALTMHQQGRFAEARSLYKEILAQQPDHFDSMHLLGVSHIQGGELELGAELVGKALKINPQSAFAHNNLGKVLKDLNRLDEALASFDQALELKPNYPEALNNRGNLLVLLGRPEEACASFKTALKIKSDYPEAWHNLAKTLKDLEEPEEAIKAFDQALLLRPGFVDALLDRCKTLVELDRFKEALETINQVLSITQQDPEAYNSQAALLLKLKRPADALKSLEAALKLKPDLVNAIINYGVALFELKRPNEALAILEKSLALNPDSSEAHFHRGNTLNRLQRFDEALLAFEQTINLDPRNIEALINKGNTLMDLRRIDEAFATLDLALTKDPERTTAKFNKSLASLLIGDFTTGWQLYENRWGCEDMTPSRVFSNPSLQWTGSELLAGKSILIYAEQGLGDSIQFVRYVESVSKLGAKIILEVQAELVSLFSELQGVDTLIQRGQNLPYFDYHCPMLSLPLAFKTTVETIPNQHTPYLFSDKTKVADWKSRLANSDKLKIGLVWSGSVGHGNDSNRSIPLSKFLSILNLPIEWHSLQREYRTDDFELLNQIPNIQQHQKDLNDFTDTAALIECLDLVIAVDTSVAHLAGAIGKEAWLLLPFNPDWRWMLDTVTTPWYPKTRLYRQPRPGDWNTVFQDLMISLEQRLIQHGPCM